MLYAKRYFLPRFTLYASRFTKLPSTSVEYLSASGGILYKSHLFMQNKPNFRKAQMNVNSFITKDYRKNDAFAVQKNKPNSNPNKPNLPDDQMNVTIYITKEYENKSNWTLRENKANTKPNKANPTAPKPRRFGRAKVS